MEEVKRWEKLPYERYEAFYDNEGRELAAVFKLVFKLAIFQLVIDPDWDF
jgi:hypothetical protein